MGRGILAGLLGLCVVGLMFQPLLAAEKGVELLEDEVEVIVDPQVAAEASWMNEENFNRWVFNANGGGNGTEKEMRAKLLNQAESEIATVDRTCGLTAVQKKKLELAARGDISRLVERIEAVRRKWLKGKKQTRANVQEFWKVVQELQVEVARDRYGPGSMFRKSLISTLTSEQTAKYSVVTKAKRERRNRARVAMAIVQLERYVPLEGEQRTKLAELIEKETSKSVDSGRYQHYVTMYRISRIPEAKLKTVLDPAQLKVFEEKVREHERLGDWLKQQGLLREVAVDEDETVTKQLSDKN